jgi:hypothetical protein
MNLLKTIFLIGIVSFSTTTFAQFTDQINSNRPGNSAGAFSVGKKVIQLEGGLNYIHESHDVLDYKANGFALDLSGRYGVWREQFEVSLDVQYQMDKYTSDLLKTSRNGLRQVTIGAKYLFYDPYKKGEEKPNIYSWKANKKFKWKTLIPALSGYVGGNYTMENDFSIPGESVFSPKVMIIAQNHFKNKWVFVTNIIADKIGSTNSSFGYIFTITYGINDKWSAMFENRGIKGDYYSDGIFTLGATHLLKDNLQVDISINKNIKTTPDLLYGGIGCSWRFDKKHKDPKMKDGKEVKEDKKDKKKGGVLSDEELQEAAEKAEKKKKKNKDSDIEDTEKPVEEKKKRLDDFEEGKEE